MSVKRHTSTLMSSINVSDAMDIHEDNIDLGLLLYIILMAVTLTFSILSNALVIYCVARFKKLRTVTNILICNLSVSDILLAGFVMPQRLHDITHPGMDFYEGEMLCKIINFSPVLVISSSIYTLVTVSFERRQVIIANHNQGQGQRITNRKIIAVTVLIWALAVVVSAPTFIEYTVQVIDIYSDNATTSIRSCSSQFSTELALGNSIFVLTVSYLIPVILLTKNYLQLAVYMWDKLKKIKMTLQPTGRNLKNIRLFMQRTRVIKLLVMVAAVFAVSWLPYFGILIYAKATGNDTSEHAAGFVNLLLLALAAFSTAYNVVLYVVFNPSFKQAIIGVLKCAKASEMKARINVEQSHQTPITPQDESVDAVSVIASTCNSRDIAVITTHSSFSSLGEINNRPTS